MIFGRRKKERLEDRKLILASHIEQLKKELDNKDEPDYKQSLQDTVNALVSSHLTESGHTTQHQKTNGPGYSPQS